MSSSLEYILSSFDEETPAAATASSSMAYPFYEGSSPWIASASSLTAQPLGAAPPESDSSRAIRRIREATQLYTYPRTADNLNLSSYTGSASVPTSGAYFTYQPPSYEAMEGMARRASSGGTSMSTGSTAGATSAPSLPSPYILSPSVASPATGAALTRARSPLNFTYRPRSQQDRLRTLFPHEDETSLQEMTRAVAAIARASEARGERVPWMNLNAGFLGGSAGGLFSGIGASFGETAEVSGGTGEEESIQTIDFGEEGDSEDEDASNSDSAEVLRNLATGGTVHASLTRTESPVGFASAGAGSVFQHLGEATANILAQVAHLGETPQPRPANHASSRARCQPATSILEHLSNDDKGEQSGEEEDSKPSAVKTTIRKRNQPTTESNGEEPASKKHKCDEEATCCICLEIPTKEDLASISGCSHPFCFTCIEKWADRENTCPLCKARFNRIEKVNGRTSEKNVTNRNQRSDLGFMGGMDLFGGMGMESTGTWPTHIAQLLFSGLGASSIRGSGDRAPMGGRDVRTGRFVPGASAHLYEPFPVPAPPRVGFSSRRPQAFASSLSGSGISSSNNADVEPLDDFLDRVHAHRTQRQFSSSNNAAVEPMNDFLDRFNARRAQRESEQRQQLQALRDNVEATTSVYSSTSLLGTTTTTYPFHTTTTRSTVTTTTTMAGPPLNPFGSIDLSQTEEEDILASTSPTSYIRRIHRDLDRNTDSYQFSTSPSGAPSVSASNWATLDSAFASIGGARNDEAGRTAETALEIDDSDDDDVEVLAVEAMM